MGYPEVNNHSSNGTVLEDFLRNVQKGQEN